jgi:hypothetical protein
MKNRGRLSRRLVSAAAAIGAAAVYCAAGRALVPTPTPLGSGQSAEVRLKGAAGTGLDTTAALAR